MIIGVPKEIKTNENRIALVPAGAESLTAQGHTVLVEQGAGIGSGFPDAAYAAVGGCIVPTADEVWQKAEMIMKVKEPIEVEWPRMRKGQLIYTYFHFAAAEKLTRAVIDSGAVAVAYETVQLPSGELPLLTPMSEVAGRMSVQQGAKYLEKVFGGSGVLLGGVPGVSRVTPVDQRGTLTSFEIDCHKGEDRRREVARLVVSSDWGLVELRPSRLSLEEIFLQLTTDEAKSAAPDAAA